MKKGFTLIELLVTVSIIAILAGIGLVIYTDVQKGVRDAKRKQDLRSLQTALQVYYQQNGRFPCSDPGGGDTALWQKSSDTTDPWINDLGCGLPIKSFVDYISSLPKDPKNTTDFPWVLNQYSYAYWSGNVENITGCPKGKAQYYILVAKLEKGSDLERSAQKPYYFCNGSEIIGNPQIIPGSDIENLFIITSQD